MTGNNPKLDLVNFDVHTTFGQIMSICYHDISGNEIMTSIKSGNFVKTFAKNGRQQFQAKFCQCCQLVLKILSGNEI